jgi:tRNA-dihydrouridine synthase B
MSSLWLAPLHGVTNRLFRKAFFAHFGGFSATLGPFILALERGAAASGHFKDYLPRDEGPVPLVPQLLGNDGAAFAATARLLAEGGYGEVNWNLGCPFPMVARKFRGSGLLPYPDRIRSFLDLACARSPIPVSVKTRLGRTSPEELAALIPVLNEYPLARVIIHPRLGVQMYRGTVDLEAFAAAAPEVRAEVVYNGDIFRPEDHRRLRERFPGVGAWMLGRGALRDPTLAGRISAADGAGTETDGPDAVAAGTRGARMDRLCAFHDELYAAYRGSLSSPAHLLDKMKEVWRYLSWSFPERERTIAAVRRARTPQVYERTVSDLFAGRGTGRCP